jgi:hypothetical protein
VHNASEAGPTAGGTNRVFSIGNAEDGDPTGLDADGGISLGNFGAAGFWGIEGQMKYGSNIGKNPLTTDPFAGNYLADDHPISFSYQKAYEEKLAKDQSLKDPTTISSLIRFFGPDKQIECSTCHDPHVYYAYDTRAGGWRPDADTVDPARGVPYRELRPFLAKSNKGSGLCLSCHNK